MRHILCSVVVLVASSSVLAQTPPAAATLQLTFASNRVSASGATGGGDVVMVSYGRSWRSFHNVLERRQMVARADAAGNVSMEVPSGVPPMSLWIAVDVASGSYGAGMADGSVPRQRAIDAGALKKDNNGQLKKLIAGLPMAYAVLVRPGESAWELFAGDGGAHDGDRTLDGRTEFSLDDFQAMAGEAAPPKNFRKGDLLILISPEELAFSSIRLEK
jgi:hypothetical protein